MRSLLLFVDSAFSVLPKFPQRLVYSSLAVSLLGGTLFGLLSVEVKEEFLPYNAQLVALTSSLLLDPWLWQLISAATISVILLRLAEPEPFPKRLFVASLPVLTLGAAWGIGTLLLKPVFGYPRFPERLAEPPFTAAVRSLLALVSIGEGESTPSGFVLRQVSLAWLMILVLHQERIPNSKTGRIGLHILNVLVLILVSFLRYYRRELV